MTLPSPRILEELRAAIRQRESAPSQTGWGVLPTGLPPFDAILPGGGFPVGRVTELSGPPASGKLTLALHAAARLTREGKPVALIDPEGCFYPPAAFALGVEGSRLLIVRPRDPGQALRTATQIARSRAFSLVVLDLLGRAVPRAHLGPLSSRLFEAAQSGRATLLLLSQAPSGLDTTLRVGLERTPDGRLSFVLERNRMGAPGRRGVSSA